MIKNKTGRNIVQIMGIPIDSTPLRSVLRNVQVYIQKKRKFYILTPNSELVLAATKDTKLKEIITNAHISVPDGVGLLAAHEFLKTSVPDNTIGKYLKLFIKGINVGVSVLFYKTKLQKELKIIKGRELFLDLVALANKYRYKVFLLGGEGTEAEDTLNKLKKNYKSVILRASKGPIIDREGNPATRENQEQMRSILEQINSFAPHLLFVGMGSGKQERWLYKYFDQLNIGGAMVVGNTFRFISGHSKVAPVFVSGLGLEWLWRLLTGSQKLHRVWNAVVVFPSRVLQYKLAKKGK